MHVVKPHFVFSTQTRFWPHCHGYQGISQKLLLIVTPNLHKYLWRYSTSLQYTCNLQKLCIGNMPEKFLEQYANFYEKLHNLCKWEICKLANQHFFVILLKELVNTFHLISYSWKSVDWLPLGYLKQGYSNILKIWGDYPLCGVITQLAARCGNVNMGFQKQETISFDLMYVDKWSTHKTHVQVWGNKLLWKVK